MPELIEGKDPVTSDMRVWEGPEGSLCRITFQKGAMELGRNGFTTAEVLDILIQHLSFFQEGPYRCRENAIVLTKLEEAKLWVEHRARTREAQGLKGREGAHK